MTEHVCPTCGGVFYGRRKNRRTFCRKECFYMALQTERHPGQPRKTAARDAIGHPSPRDLEWAAGFYEGEGSCRAVVSSTEASIGQQNPEPLNKMLYFFGGSIGIGRCRSGKPFGTWHVHGTRARGFLMTIYALVSARRRQQIRAALGA